MARLSYFLLASAALFTSVATATNSAVLDLIPSNFDKVVFKSGKPGLVEFFAPWCGHCRTLAPIYEELGHLFAHASDKVHISKVDADANRSLGKKFGVQGFPTLKWFDGKSEKPVEYEGQRDLESLAKFVSEKTGIRPKGLKKAAGVPSLVTMLTDTTFKETVGGEKDVIVAFTAPWCGHCKTLAPIWETLASDFALEPNVVIAKVDAEAENAKATAQDQGVKSYPTIKFFPRGSTEAEIYSGGRSEQDLVTYINEKAGTQRTVGGGLNAQAGRVASLDSIIEKYVSGEITLQKIMGDVKAGAKDLQEKYAAYYVRVADKLNKNAEYAGKELARLEKILEKGGLAPEKVDDLISRSNVLRKWLGKEKEEGEKAKDEL
ncbi:protein disulfide-isomerase domain [Polytolypa hystricis UAMH7299]|uniref:protein disulfide-isomerase n=1 Tax=Polytolypa hystricis (strain UAMH7299) TaxID=1447883 RepID=A0A2B7Y5K4_POLH7|nr:protein disulfide-isomerase domain [Polytolypa hystricis UAMH7299]